MRCLITFGSAIFFLSFCSSFQLRKSKGRKFHLNLLLHHRHKRQKELFSSFHRVQLLLIFFFSAISAKPSGGKPCTVCHRCRSERSKVKRCIESHRNRPFLQIKLDEGHKLDALIRNKCRKYLKTKNLKTSLRLLQAAERSGARGISIHYVSRDTAPCTG